MDVSRTVRRKLDMSSVPDVVQTSQPQIVQIDDDLPSPTCDNISDVHATDEDEFFLSKNSKLFSQVSSNTLTATETETFNAACAQQNPFCVVEVKEMEIVKSIASPEDHVILPSANVSVGLLPQVVERVEIVEDTETEPESIDTDTEDKESRGKMPITVGLAEQIVNKKKELVPILKKKIAAEPTPAKNIKRLILKLDLDANQEDATDSSKATTSSTSAPLQKTTNTIVDQETNALNKTSGSTTSTWKDTESVAEYLILDDNEEIEKSDVNTSSQVSCAKIQDSVTKLKHKDTQKIKSEKSTEYLKKTHGNVGNTSRSEDEKLCKRTQLVKRMRSLSKDDTLEDCESFYGSDKETDDVLVFSDDTEIDVGSSSSDGEDTNLGEHVEHLLDKVTNVPRIHATNIQQLILLVSSFNYVGLNTNPFDIWSYKE